MNRNTRAIQAGAGGFTALVAYLVAEKLINGGLVAQDYIISVTTGVLTALAIFFLFRNRSGRNSG